MDYLEQAKKEIRESWFKNHNIKSMVGEEGFQRISWGEKGTRMYQVDYVLSDNMVFISGDLGEAAYSLTCRATMENLKDFDLSYFTGKLSAHRREKYEFDEKLARKEIKDYFFDWCGVESTSEMLKVDRELYSQIINETREWSNCNHFSTAIFNIYSNTDADWFDAECVSCIADCGQRLSYSMISYWVGLKMIAEQLEGLKEQTA